MNFANKTRILCVGRKDGTMKYYFSIEGITMDMNSNEAAWRMCTDIEKILKNIGISEAEVYYDDEDEYQKNFINKNI